ncbi:hypothetical protein B0H13DRAFT_1994588, partial [Mycena leptocephala]
LPGKVRRCLIHPAGRDVFAQPGAVVHDFLDSQLVRDAYPDFYARKILTELRSAATPPTTLVILDHVIPYACSQPKMNPDAPVPAPLL